jgi:hypothetical protein
MKLKLLPLVVALAPGLCWAGTPISQTKAVDADATHRDQQRQGRV